MEKEKIIEESLNQELLTVISTHIKNKAWSSACVNLKTLVNHHLNENELTQWVHHLADIYIALSVLYEEEKLPLLSKADSLLTCLFEKHLLTHSHYFELCVALLAHQRFDESAAFLGAAIQFNSNIYQYAMWALQCPIHDKWDKKIAESIFTVFDHLATHPKLIKILCRLHQKGIEDYRKALGGELLTAKEEQLKQFAILIEKGLHFIQRMIAYGEFESAEILLNRIEELLPASLRNEKDQLIKRYRLAIEKKASFSLELKTIPLPNTLKIEQQTLTEARIKLKKNIEQVNEQTSFEICTQHLKTYQTEILNAVQLIVQNLMPHIGLIFGAAPCHWALIVGGSHGRGDMKTTSDLEAALLIENPKHKEHPYFKAILPILQKRLLILGEAWNYQGTDFHCDALHVDGGNFGLIDEPKALAQWVFQTLTEQSNSNKSQKPEKILAYGLCYTQSVFVSHPDFQALAIFQKTLSQLIQTQNPQWQDLQKDTLELYRHHIPQKMNSKIILSAISKIVFATHSFEQSDYFHALKNMKWFNPVFHQHLLYMWVQLIKQRILNQSNQIDLEWCKQTLLIPFYHSTLDLNIVYAPWKNCHDSADVLVVTLRYGQSLDLPITKIQPLWEKEMKILQENFPKQWTPQTQQTWLYPNAVFTIQELLSALIYHGAHSGTLLDDAFKEKQLGWLLLLINSGIGRKTQTPVTEYVQYFEQAPAEWQPLIESTLKRWAKLNTDLNWFINKKILFEPVRSKEELARFVEGIEVKQQLLKEEVFKQMFETKSTAQAVKKDNDYGRRAVAKIQIQEQIFFFKFLPEAPPMEDAVQQLAHAYFPNTIPHSELIRYENGKGETIPILISEGIQGYNLQDIFNALSDEPKVQAEALKKSIKLELVKSCLDNIDHYSFSQQVLLTLFTNDEDGKPDNKYLVPFQQGDKTLYRIISIDNDHSFLEPLHIDKGKRTLQLKSILFCLNHMKRPLHPQAVAEFLKLDATQCIEQWLKKLIARQEQYFKLFDSHEKNPDSIREALLKKEVILQLIFPKRSIAKLWEKWIHAQDYLKHHPETMALELLRQVMPEVALFYAQAFKETTPLKRFDQIAGKSYTSIMVGKIKLAYVTNTKSTQLLKLEGISSKTLTQKENGLSLINSLDELHSAKHEHVNIEHILKEVEKGLFGLWEQLYLDNNKTAVINALDWRKLNEKQQKQLLELLAAKELNARALLLNHCVILNDSILESLLIKMPGLQQLSIIDGQITDKLWALLFDYCESVQSIRLENLAKLSNTTQGLLNRATELPELTELTLKNLPLKNLKIKTPQLKTFTFDKLPELTSVETQSTTLETFFIQDTTKLNLEGLANSFETMKPFKKGLLPTHWQSSKNLVLYLSYPFLLSRESFKWVSKFSEDCNELLKSFSKEAISTENLLTLKQLIEAHCKQINLAEKTLPKLLERLKDSNEDVREAAAQAFGNFGQYATETVIAALLERLKDSEWSVRSAAAYALGHLGLKAATEPVIAALLERLKDSSEDVRSAVAQALGYLGQYASEPVIAALLERLKDSDGGVREAAVQALGYLAPKAATELVIKVLLERLSEWQVCKAAAQALGKLGPKAATEPVIAALLERLKDSDLWVRKAAAQALGKLGPKAATEPVIAALLERLKDSDLWVRKAAAQALCKLGPKAATEPVIKALLEKLKDSDWQVREAAIQALSNLGRYAIEPVITVLLQKLKDAYSDARSSAAYELGYLGPKAATEPVIAALLSALKDSDKDVRRAAARALGHLGPKAATEPVIAALLEMLKDSSEHVREAAAHALGTLGTKAAIEPVIAALLERLKDSNEWVRRFAAQALGNLGQYATEFVIAALLERLKDSSGHVREAAAHAFVTLGTKAAIEPVIAALLKRLKDSGRYVREAAAQALGNLGSKAATELVIAALLERLKDSEWVRYAAAEALGNLTQSLNQSYQSFFDTLTEQKNAYLAEIHKIELTVSPTFTETQLIEQLKKAFKSTTPIMKIKIHGLKIQSKEALLLIQKWIESNPSSLIHLDLEQNIFKSGLLNEFISETLSQCNQLQSIHLNHTQLDDSVWPALEIILPQLKSLSLKQNQLKDIEPLLEILPECTKLTHLYLQGNLFSPADVQPLLKADLNPELKQHLQQQFENNALTQLHLFSSSTTSNANPINSSKLEFS